MKTGRGRKARESSNLSASAIFMKKILLFANKDIVVNFRFELIQELIKTFEVEIVCPPSPKLNIYKNLGIKIHEINLSPRGINLFLELKTYKSFLKILKKVKPDLVLTYTIKPNIYGSFASKKFNIPIISTITGLGATSDNYVLKLIISLLYKISMKNNNYIFVQNESIKKYFLNRLNFPSSKLIQVNGSGVNLERFKYSSPTFSKPFRFLFLGRTLKSKGIMIFLSAAKILKEKKLPIEFIVIGEKDRATEKKLNQSIDEGKVLFKNFSDQIEKEIANVNCVVLPALSSEGMSNVLLESCAIGRPIIATKKDGIKEILIDYKNGFFIKTNSVNDLVTKIIHFISLSKKSYLQMSKFARESVSTNFDRKKINDVYLNYILLTLNMVKSFKG